MKTVILKMTNAYDNQDFYHGIPDCFILDFKNLQGTRCYLDDVAKEEIKTKLSDYDYSGIHFIDSGNYHYLSLFWLAKIDVDFNLILLDHHPDNQAPSFGNITSCGGWVLEATETLPHLKNVYTYGVGAEIDPAKIPTDLPCFISIDKDILDPEYALTDWDQGTMTLAEMQDLLQKIISNRKILGVDICGEGSEIADNGHVINNQTNTTLFDFLSENI